MRLGAIFDWDGVILDSRDAHKLSWEQLAEEEQRPLPADHFERGFGRTNQIIIPEILEWATEEAEVKRLGFRKEELYRKALLAGDIEPLPGVREFLAELREAGVPCVVGSSTPLLNLETAIEALELEGFFCDTVSGDDVKRGKPDPEVFLIAAEKAGIPPERCAVFEDSHHGIEAALAGGMRAVALATTHPAEEHTHAHFVVNDLSEMTLQRFKDLFG